jgi:hypothetical protein
MVPDKATINGIDFTLTELKNNGFSVGVHKWCEKFDKEHFIIKTVHRPFDKRLFYFPHTPIVIDEVFNMHKFSMQNNLRVLDMPIKFPGNPLYNIPRELNQFDDIIAKAVAFEHGINPNVDKYYAYLTIDQGLVPANTFQRKPGCHVNGFQGYRIIEKRPVNRSYIVYDKVPPIFYPQSFKTDHLDEMVDNFFLSFDEQADETAGITFDPYHILLTNAYTVFKEDKVDVPVYKTFFRLSYDTLPYDRYGNTHNPLFNYKWAPRIPRNLSSFKFKPLPHHPDAL